MDLTSLGATIGFAYTSASVWKIARKTGKKAFMVTGALGTVISVAYTVVQLIPGLTALETMSATAFLLLMIWCLLGFMFYLRTVARSSLSSYNGNSASGVVMFALLLYAALMWLAKKLLAADSLSTVKRILDYEGGLILLVIFIGLAVMMYIQRLVRRKYEEAVKVKEDGDEGVGSKEQGVGK